MKAQHKLPNHSLMRLPLIGIKSLLDHVIVHVNAISEIVLDLSHIANIRVILNNLRNKRKE